MKKKLSITLASFASLATGIMTPLLSSCSTDAKLQITMEGSKWGYIISEVKPYYEYKLTLSNGFKKGDVLEMEIVNPSTPNKIKLHENPMLISGDDINSINVQIDPCSYDPGQEQFSVNFSLKISVKRAKNIIYLTQIDSLILDAVIPATNPNYYTYEDPDNKTILTGIDVSYHDELLKTGCLVIPETVKTIKSKAFAITPQTSTEMKEIYQSNRWLLLDYSVYDDTKTCSLETIENQAFFQNEYFKESLYIPKTVKRIGESAFCRCYNFTQIKFADNSEIAEIGNNAFQEVWSVVEPLEIPKNTTLTKLPRSFFVGANSQLILCKGIKISNNIQQTIAPVFRNFLKLEWIDLSDFDEVPAMWSTDTFGKKMPKTGVVYVKDETTKNQWQEFLKDDLPGWTYEIKN